MTNHALQLTEFFDAVHLLFVLLQFSSVTSYFDVYSLSIAEYENEMIAKILLTAEEPLQDLSKKVFLEREIYMLYHQGQFSIPAIVSRGSVCASVFISYSLAYDATDVVDNDNLATDLHSADRHGQKTISRVNNLD